MCNAVEKKHVLQYIAENESGKNESALGGAYPYDIMCVGR